MLAGVHAAAVQLNFLQLHEGQPQVGVTASALIIKAAISIRVIILIIDCCGSCIFPSFAALFLTLCPNLQGLHLGIFLVKI